MSKHKSARKTRAKGPSAASPTVPVTVATFPRAESDLYFVRAVAEGAFGKFSHSRGVTPINKQMVVRMNRDTIYSMGVFDLDAGPVTITLPDTGSRFMSMAMISEDHYVIDVVYAPVRYECTRQAIGTRYVLVAIRTLANPEDKADVKAACAAQDQITMHQPSMGTFVVPTWDRKSQGAIRDALAVLGQHAGFDRAFGRKNQVDPIAHLIGSAIGWGGNPAEAAMYAGVTPKDNDGRTPHVLTVKDVPVDGFWSVSVYNAKGFFQKNPQNAYSINNLTADKNPDGSVTINFGGKKGQPNVLPITRGWNYTVRMYRPRKAILDGTWKFPEATPAAR